MKIDSFNEQSRLIRITNHCLIYCKNLLQLIINHTRTRKYVIHNLFPFFGCVNNRVSARQ